MSSPDLFPTNTGDSQLNPYLYPPGHDYASQHPSFVSLQDNPVQADWGLYPAQCVRPLQQTARHRASPSLQRFSLVLHESDQSPVPYLSPSSLLAFNDNLCQHYDLTLGYYRVDLFNAASYIFDPSTTIGIQQMEDIIMMHPTTPYDFLEQYSNRRQGPREDNHNKLFVTDHQSEGSWEVDREHSPATPTQFHHDITIGELIIQMECGCCGKQCLSEAELTHHRNSHHL